MKKFKLISLLLGSLVLCLVFAACGGAGSNQTNEGQIANGADQESNTGDVQTSNGGVTNIRFATTNVGGTGYMYVTAIATMANNTYEDLKVDVYTPGSAIDNTRALIDGSAEIALGAAAHIDAYNGIGSFEGQEPSKELRGMWRGYMPYMQIIVEEDSGIDEISDLKGKRIATGEPGSQGAVLFEEVTTAAGMIPDDYTASPMTLQDGANALKDGNVDALAAIYGPGAPAIEELASSRNVKWLEIGENIFSKIMETRPAGYYSSGLLLAGSYTGLDEDLLTVGTPVIWVTRSDVSEDAIYKITKAFFENIEDARKIHPVVEQTIPEESGKDFGIPMHPGAAKYFDEVGWEHDPAE